MQFGTTDVQSTATNTPGISVLNLRGLGPNRNLVLVNGRRAQPANVALVVDVNTIPAAAINFLTGPTNNFYFNDDGTAFVARQAIGYEGPVYPETQQFKILSNGNLAERFLQSLVSSPLERYSLFARSTYDLGENIQAFVQGNFTSVQVDQVLQYSPSTLGWGAAVPNDGRAIPAELQLLLDSRPMPEAGMPPAHADGHYEPNAAGARPRAHGQWICARLEDRRPDRRRKRDRRGRAGDRLLTGD
jgi:hypothetical protein